MAENPENAAKARGGGPTVAAGAEEEVASLAKRHRLSPAIVREVMRRVGSTERAAVEREIRKGKERR